MPRASRDVLPNHIWHLTHRCHQRDFLLKCARDRPRWRQWLFEAVGVVGPEQTIENPDLAQPRLGGGFLTPEPAMG